MFSENHKKKIWCSLALGVNLVITYFRMFFFQLEVFYLVGMLICFILLLILRRSVYFHRLTQVILGLHLVFHGMVMLSLPVGLVFALIGSYWLALKVLVTIYLPSLLLVFLNSYLLFGERLFIKRAKK